MQTLQRKRCQTASRKKSSFSRLRAHARCVRASTTPKQNALFPVASVSGALVLRFPGQYADDEAGNFYNYFRSYDPKIRGGYIQPDPIGLAGGWNRGVYVEGNPLSYSDPLGLNPIAGAIGGAQVGTAIFPGVGTVIGGAIGAGLGVLAGYGLDRMLAKPGNESKPANAPPGTILIDQTGLGRGDVHDIKDGVGNGPRDWTGIAPNGDVITSDPRGRAVNNGPADSYTKRPTGLCK